MGQGGKNRACIVSGAVSCESEQEPAPPWSAALLVLSTSGSGGFFFFFGCLSYTWGTQSRRLNSRSRRGRGKTVEPSVLNLRLFFALCSVRPRRLCFYVRSHLHVMHWR